MLHINKYFQVWYQKFEYAIGHWLQKSTEHVMGCVLCSPGCFSLFRGRALMDANVMRRYTTNPTQPRHFVQVCKRLRLVSDGKQSFLVFPDAYEIG